jgi:hypothetical protein
MSDPSPLANVDWEIVAAGLATFIGSIYLTIVGARKGKKKVQEGSSSSTSIVGASLIETETIRSFTEQMRINNQMMHDLTEEVRRNTAAVTRQTDLDLIRSKDN